MININLDKKRKYDIVVIGRVTIDLNPTDIHKTLDLSKNYNKYLGGSAGNIVIGLARHNVKTAFITCLSKDQFGKYIFDYLKKNGVDMCGIQIAKNGEKTGLTFTEIKSPIESSILMYRSNVADLALKPNNKNEEIIKNSKVLLISGTALSASPSRETVIQAIEFAKKHNTKIVFDIDYRPYSWKSINETQIYYNLVAEQADIIIGSRMEFNLAEKIYFNNKGDDKQTIKHFFSKNASLIIIKYDGDGSYAFLKNGDTYKVDIFKIKLLKSFGGGDAYISSLLYGLFNNQTLEKSLTYATAAAANAVASHSSSDALLTNNELKSFIAKNKENLPVVKKI